ncbi:MAG: RCC1 domain-containing protein, partial [Verrucomicrobiota bacterium]
MAIAAGGYQTEALKNDGGLVAWVFLATVPVAVQSGVTAIAAGGYHSVALKDDGSMVAWGANSNGQTNVPV